MQLNQVRKKRLGYKTQHARQIYHWTRACLLGLYIVLVLAYPVTSQEHSDCIAIIGDSLAYGSQVVELHGTGYATIQTRPFSQVLADLLAANAYDYVRVRDFSLPATALIAPNSPGYQTSLAFSSAQESPCQFTIIFPWLNDLAEVSQQLNFSAYSIALNELIIQLSVAKPDTHFLLLSYYHAPLTAVGLSTYGANPADEVIAGMNRIHEQYCEALANIDCLNLSEILSPIEASVSLSIPFDEFGTYGYRAMDEAGQISLDAYFMRFPSGAAMGDGIHLNPRGKEQVAQAVFQRLQEIDPLFACQC